MTRCLTHSLMTITRSARRAARSYASRRNSRSPRGKSSGRSRCCTSRSVSTVGRRDPGDGDGQRVVDEIRAPELCAQGSRAQGRAPHGEEPAGSGRGCAVASRDDGREAAACVRSERGDQRLVVVRPPARQRAAQLAGVRLAPARDPGNERQERQAHAHRRILRVDVRTQSPPAKRGRQGWWPWTDAAAGGRSSREKP